MKESYREDLANHFGHESYADDGNVVGVATAATQLHGVENGAMVRVRIDLADPAKRRGQLTVVL